MIKRYFSGWGRSMIEAYFCWWGRSVVTGYSVQWVVRLILNSTKPDCGCLPECNNTAVPCGDRI